MFSFNIFTCNVKIRYRGQRKQNEGFGWIVAARNIACAKKKWSKVKKKKYSSFCLRYIWEKIALFDFCSKVSKTESIPNRPWTGVFFYMSLFYQESLGGGGAGGGTLLAEKTLQTVFDTFLDHKAKYALYTVEAVHTVVHL